MNYKVYTKKGDKGRSSTVIEKEIPKHTGIFNLLGQFDELNSLLGLFCSYDINGNDKVGVRKIQRLLFQAGEQIALDAPVIEMWKKEIKILEKDIDVRDSKNLELKTFILPGGTTESSIIHMARASCRKLEREMWKWVHEEEKEEFSDIGAFINRLSDWLFVFARNINKFGKNDITWTNKTS